MKVRLSVGVLLVGAAASVTALAAGPKHAAQTSFITSGAPELTTLAPGVTYAPLITTGDTLPNGHQFAGVPDGIGVYRRKGETRVIINHELQDKAPLNAMVSEIAVVPKSTGLLRGRFMVGSSNSFRRFCASSLTVAAEGRTNDQGFSRTTYFTGEEVADGKALMVDPLKRGPYATYHQIKGLGLGPWENLNPLHGYGKPVLLAGEDGGQAGTFGTGSPMYGQSNYTDNRSQMWMYVSPSESALRKDKGRLYVLTGATAGDAAGKPDDGMVGVGTTINVAWTPVGDEVVAAASAGDPYMLDRVAESLGAFTFVRIEDTTQVPGSSTVYFSDTGAKNVGGTTKGRIYKLTLDKAVPTRPGTLTVLLDGDVDESVVNPDNVTATSKGILIQEDRNSEHRATTVAGGYSRIRWFDFATGKLTDIGQPATDPTDSTGKAINPGEWETSGGVPAAEFFGPDTWLVAIQAHSQKVGQSGGVGEGGQVGVLTIPNSQ